MCRAAPVKVIAIDEESNMAIVDLDGIRKEISLALVEGVSVGDYVIVHVGFALQKLDIAETERMLRLMAEADAVILVLTGKEPLPDRSISC
jgi:hydrogenase expression/formation protein HypC